MEIKLVVMEKRKKYAFNNPYLNITIENNHDDNNELLDGIMTYLKETYNVK